MGSTSQLEKEAEREEGRREREGGGREKEEGEILLTPLRDQF